MKDFDLLNEIKVVENIIRLLNDCLAISMKNKRKEECKRIIVDIKNCEIELHRLIEIRTAKEEAEAKEPLKGNAV
jgi:phosphopantothenate synthetase